LREGKDALADGFADSSILQEVVRSVRGIWVALTAPEMMTTSGEDMVVTE
jgi:hypothetical protein